MSALRSVSLYHADATSMAVWFQRAAIRALYYELAASPKPGLVTLDSSGSHEDMDATTFFRSLLSQRHYYLAIARASAQGANFSELQELGLMVERRMLLATGGINTHRGALFSLGLLAAAGGRLAALKQPVDSVSVAALVSDVWGEDIRRSRSDALDSPGMGVFRRYGAGGARAEAADGFPTILNKVLPALQAALANGASLAAAAVQTLFAAITILEDTNLLHRGGPEGLEFARGCAAMFLADGGVHRPDWQAEAVRIADAFVVRRLSPGGSADALAIALFLWQIDHREEQLIWV